MSVRPISDPSNIVSRDAAIFRYTSRARLRPCHLSMAFESVPQTPVTVLFESFERERWASDVSTNTLESLSVATRSLLGHHFDLGAVAARSEKSAKRIP
jgi:hypothetical protein